MKKKFYLQYAALPFRVEGGELLIMLVTSRETHRWIIPKGWPEKNLKPYQVAETEAYEEAGLRGGIVKTPIAAFEYQKILGPKQKVTCLVDVFPLKVREILDSWPEQTQRKRAWMRPEEAAAAVVEKGLKRLLLAFAKDPEQADFAD
ncbi:NUDIX hydrolase [Telmatospirillum siberiense]|uniref:NUDIX hydrolase n=1 Tax=Telmatospirillum siberiense TaxID=382514 RepID=A0A2N3PUW8_9PROT|nr:NUDIX hydrolase [Telmatospirillum siberiense]PKU24185.1 NUDIX hydrolase [Telmatospirillum siberiense]